MWPLPGSRLWPGAAALRVVSTTMSGCSDAFGAIEPARACPALGRLRFPTPVSPLQVPDSAGFVPELLGFPKSVPPLQGLNLDLCVLQQLRLSNTKTKQN